MSTRSDRRPVPAAPHGVQIADDAALPTVVGHWLVLLRARIAVMVLLTALIGAWIATRDAAQLGRCLEAAFYVVLVTGCASILNQVLERDTDALMPRTRHRPLVTGAVGVLPAVFVASLLGIAGTVGLALSFNLLSALLVLATLVSYVAVYTPLKRASTLNTVVGAIPGAAPPLVGYAALAGDVGPWAWALFATIFVWQFPHFMAIAWLYRDDYAAAGHRMVASVPDADGLAGRQALLYSLAIVPVTLMPVLSGLAGTFYATGALVLGLAYVVPSAAFARREDRPRARRLMVISLVYLPLYFALVFLDPVARASGV